MKRRILLTIAFLSSLAVSAQQVYSLSQCREMALRNNKTLAISREEVNKATYEREAAETNKLPKISGSVSYVRLGREVSLLSNDQKSALSNLGTNVYNAMSAKMGDFNQAIQPIIEKYPEFTNLLTQFAGQGLAGADALNAAGQRVVDAFDSDNRNMGGAVLILKQPLYMGGKIMAYERITKYLEQLGGEKLRLEEQEILLDVDKAYWQVVSLVSKKQLADDYLGMLQHLEHDVDLMLKNGVATKANLLTVNVKVNEAEMMQTKVEDGLSLSRMLLCQLIGLPLNTPIVLEDENLDNIPIEYSEANANIQTAFANRPEIQQLELATNIYKEKVNIQRSDYLPHVALIGGAGLTTPSLYNGFENKLRGNWAFGITCTMPIWNWGEGRSKIKAAKAEAKIQEYRLDEAKEKIELQVNQSTFRLNEANKRLKLSKKNMEKAAENLRIANLGHREGVIATSDVLAAHTAWMQAKSDIIDAQIEVRLAHAILDKSLGLTNLDY